MTNSKLQIANRKSQIANYELRITNYDTNQQISKSANQQPATSNQQPAVLTNRKNCQRASYARSNQHPPPTPTLHHPPTHPLPHSLRPFLFLAAATLFFFWPVWLMNYRFPIGGGDLWGQLHPVWSYASEWLRRGVFPLWSTRIMAGEPLISEPQYGLLNPLNWWMFLFHPIPDWTVLLRGMLPLFIAGSGLYLYLKRSPVWKLSTTASLTGALAFMFADAFVVHLAHPQINDAISLLPWSFLSIDSILGRKKFSPLSCLPIALLGISGHYQTILYSCTAIVLYAIWRTLEMPLRTWPVCVGRLALSALLTIALAAPVVLPSLERYPLTERAILQVQPVRGYQWPIQMLVDFLTPWFHGRGVRGFWGDWARVEGGYAGVVALALAFLGFAAHIKQRRTLFMLLLGALAFLFALGLDGPIYPALIHIDLILRMGKTARIIYLVSFAIAVGAALGVHALEQVAAGTAHKIVQRLWMALLVVAGVALWLYAPAGSSLAPSEVQRATALSGLRFAAALVLGVAILSWRYHAHKWARPALLLLLLAELTVTGAFAEVEKSEPQATPAHAAAIDYLRADQGWFRVDVDASARGLWSPSVLQSLGFESPQGAGNPMDLFYYTQFYWAVPTKASPAYQLISAKYIVVPKDALPGGDGIWPTFGDDDQIDIHLNTNAMNRTWLVYDTLPVATIEEAYAHVFAEDFAPLLSATVENGPDLDNQGSGTLQVFAYGPNKVRIGVETSEDVLLILSDVVYPGWTATVDGDPAPIYKTDGIFRGIVVPAGQHDVVMRFFPTSLKLGLGFAAIALLIMETYLWRGRRRIYRQLRIPQGIAALGHAGKNTYEFIIRSFKDLLHQLASLTPADVVNYLILLVPYGYYQRLVTRTLSPAEAHDAFAYLWRQPRNLYFYTGRSLTQRMLFSLLHNDGKLIASAHLWIFGLTALGLYTLLRRNRQPLFNLLLSVGISLLFSSYTFNVTAISISAEPITLALMIAFPCILFLWPDRYPVWVPLAVGVLFIFSKSVAPYTLVPLLILRVLTTHNFRHGKVMASYGLLIVIALISMKVTQTYDTAVDINIVNNVFQRVFPFPERTAWFHEAYSMPTGPFVEGCAGGWVLTPFDGEPLLITNWEARNYDLRLDSHGFASWVKAQGRRAYMHYLLLEAPIATYQELSAAFTREMQGASINYMTTRLTFNPTQEPQDNLTRLAQGDESRKVGFLGKDPLTVVKNVLVKLGFADLETVIGYALLGFILTQTLSYKSHLPLATGLIGVTPPLFFVSYFGDAIEIDRHVFPTLILLTLGGALFFVSLLDIVYHWGREKSL